MKKKTLIIDTSSAGVIEVALDLDGMLKKKSQTQKFGSQVLLGLIQDILEEENLELKDLTNIEVNTGPGSFTGLKVGVSVANALAYSLKIPVNNKTIEDKLSYT